MRKDRGSTQRLEKKLMRVMEKYTRKRVRMMEDNFEVK